MSDAVPDLQALLDATAKGDRQAFARLYRQTAPRLLTLALRLLGERALAEEVLQEAFVQIWYGARDFRADRGSPMAWLASVVRHRALDLLRHESSLNRRAARVGQEADIDGADTAADRSHLSHELQVLMSCLDRLPDGQRRGLLLAYYYGFSHREIADRQRLPVGTVKTWLRRAMGVVRECMGL